MGNVEKSAIAFSRSFFLSFFFFVWEVCWEKIGVALAMKKMNQLITSSSIAFPIWLGMPSLVGAISL